MAWKRVYSSAARRPQRRREPLHVRVDLAAQLVEQRRVEAAAVRILEERVEPQAERLAVVVGRLQREHRRGKVGVVTPAELVARVEHKGLLAADLAGALEGLQLLGGRPAADGVGIG